MTDDTGFAKIQHVASVFQYKTLNTKNMSQFSQKESKEKIENVLSEYSEKNPKNPVALLKAEPGKQAIIGKYIPQQLFQKIDYVLKRSCVDYYHITTESENVVILFEYLN